MNRLAVVVDATSNLDAIRTQLRDVFDTGYPHGLNADQITDLVRIVTISDIFGALIERRSYKKAISCKVAYDTLLNMGPRLDADSFRVCEQAASGLSKPDCD
ncbi:HD domain-containing phosphohydrolase [Bradyrhizobium sp.]|jgi:HD-GYP domain-containing protein (c-di-GMP phosphodiesterase class II)|uniref:HD domain-containing phosphohydrolase n=1 Tax=Bradyrhizobium sp. TaxID=376 RepID=UPI003C23EACE